MGRVSHDSIAHRLDRKERATFDVRRCDSSLPGKQILMRRVLHDSIAHRLERVERVTFDGDILFVCEGSTSKVSGATPPCSIARIASYIYGFLIYQKSEHGENLDHVTDGFASKLDP